MNKKKKSNIIPTDNVWTFEFIDDVYNEIERIGKDYLKLDIYPNQIEIISADQMIDAYASHGLPIMYNHWKFGKDYLINMNKYKKGTMGLAYEIVLNTNPCISFNMEDNTACMTTLVIAHAAMGHNHLFKNNYMFKEWTDASSIVDYLSFAKNYIKECEQKYGEKEVEVVLDACHALQYWGVDKYKRTYKSKTSKAEFNNKVSEENDKLYDYLMEMTAPIKKKDTIKEYKFPVQREENILYFVEKYAPRLETWKRELIRITRKLSQYFMPQISTKVLNEGCLVEGSLISTEDGLIDIKYIVDNKYSGKVWDGEKWEVIYDWFKHENKKRIKIKTKNGYTLHGGENHKILINSNWVELLNLVISNIVDVIIDGEKCEDEIISIEEDYGTTYDFSVTNSHKYQSGPFINHNCATFVHYHILNKMFDEGLVDDGFMLEFLASHTSVVFQPEFNSPYYSGFNPYALGFAMLMDIKRICQEPTDEDREWFPDIVGKDWLDVFHDIIKNYKDETFILQFLSPKVIRDRKLKMINKSHNNLPLHEDMKNKT